MDDVAFLPGCELARKIRTREISSRELLDHYLDRIERLNGRINAVVTLDVERARRRADAADAEIARGSDVGPLCGVPITVKDSLETAGIRTTSGYPPLADHVPARDATCVERIVAAGAIVFGKTNMPVLAGDYQSHNPVFGVTHNPWDVTRTPGGSSGGSAAALAAGFAALEIGSDIAGSIRVPAHWCGVYGHKPTHGIIPSRGHIPGPPGMVSEPDLAVMGPMARSAEDLRLMLDLMAGPAPDRARGWTLALPAPRRRRLEDYRVAAWIEEPGFAVDPSVSERLRAAVRALRDAGVRVDEDARPALRLVEVLDVYLRLLWPILLAGLPPEQFGELGRIAQTFPENLADHTARMARYSTETHRDWLGADEVREQMRVAAAEFFERYDVLLTPVNQVAAIPHDHSEPQVARVVRCAGGEHPYYDLMSWIALATALRLPATAAPVGRTPEGLPVGIQIVGPHLEDRTTIDFAARLADVVGGFEPPRAFADA